MDDYERGRQNVLAELMEYTYGMLTTEKLGLQHKIKSMMETSEPQTESCEDCYYARFDADAYPCSRCVCNAPSENMFKPQTEQTDCSWK